MFGTCDTQEAMASDWLHTMPAEFNLQTCRSWKFSYVIRVMFLLTFEILMSCLLSKAMLPRRASWISLLS